MHQVGNALVHGHHVQDSYVRRHVAGSRRFPVGPCVSQVLGKVDASPEQVAPSVRRLEAGVDDGLSRVLRRAVVQHGASWQRPVRGVDLMPNLHHAQALTVLAGGCHQGCVQLVLVLKAGPQPLHGNGTVAIVHS